MGGNLFSSERLNNQEYKRIGDEITEKLLRLNVKSSIPDGLRDKTSHGDLDLICSSPVPSDEQFRAVFGKDLQIHRNTDTISIFYESRYQADLNFHPEIHLQSAHDYNRGSDAGNLIGVLFSRIGYSYGHKGLQYCVNLAKEDALGKILVSKDQRKILEFIGLDYDKWLVGFENRIDLYKWVSNSKYFNKDFYKFENLVHKNRIRNKKRPVFCEFVKWLQEQEFENNFIIGDKSDYIWKGLLHFGDEWWVDKARPLIEERRRKMQIRDIFNGSDLLVFGYSGGELGRVLKSFKDSIPDFDNFVLTQTKPQMIELFKIFIDNSQN